MAQDRALAEAWRGARQTPDHGGVPAADQDTWPRERDAGAGAHAVTFEGRATVPGPGMSDVEQRGDTHARAFRLQRAAHRIELVDRGSALDCGAPTRATFAGRYLRRAGADPSARLDLPDTGLAVTENDDAHIRAPIGDAAYRALSETADLATTRDSVAGRVTRHVRGLGGLVRRGPFPDAPVQLPSIAGQSPKAADGR